MTRLDGNAIAGQLFDIFGEDMTTATGTCSSCGSTRPLGELAVYLQAPGVVARCSSCDKRDDGDRPDPRSPLRRPAGHRGGQEDLNADASYLALTNSSVPDRRWQDRAF